MTLHGFRCTGCIDRLRLKVSWLWRTAALLVPGGWGQKAAPIRGRASARKALFSLMYWLLLPLLVACPRTTPAPQVFDGERAYAWVDKQCALGPRVPGSTARDAALAMFRTELERLGWTVEEQAFDFQGVQVRNLLAWRGTGEAVLVGAHYDSRASADRDDPTQAVPGANDGASGAAVLLELARVVETDWTQKRVYVAFFDAEDQGELNGWPWSVGAEAMAAGWETSGHPPLKAVVVVDMVGDATLELFYDGHSDGALRERLWGIAAEAGYTAFVPRVKYFMIDDHLPFAQRGVPAVDIIDFDYPYWHTTQDTPDKVAPQSLEAVGQVIERWLEGETIEGP